MSPYTEGQRVCIYLYLSTNLWGIPLHCDFFRKKNRPEKKKFLRTNKGIVLAIWWPVKYFFPRRLRKPANATRFAFQANAVRQSKSLATCFAHNFFAFDFCFILKRICVSVWNIKDLNIGEKNLTNIRP